MRRALAAAVVSLAALAAAAVAQAAPRERAVVGTVTVTITDRTLRVTPLNPESGSTKFVVLNKGKRGHVFAIAGPGVKGVRTGKIAPGRRATLTVKLRPGAYVLSDPVGLGAYTSAFLDVIRASTLTSRGGGSKVQAGDSEPPEMCGVYFTP